MLLGHPAWTRRSADARRVMVGTGGAAPTIALIEQLDSIGFDLTHPYEQTECYGPCTINSLPPGLAGAPAAKNAVYLATQGCPHATAPALRVIDGAGADVPADGRTQGEIVLRGSTIMAGYLDDPAATDAAFDGDWFRSGDIAVIEGDGRIHVRDRARDVIITGGENVSSHEVEDILHRHPGVALAAVVAAPHPQWGETPCAFIEARHPVDAAELDAFCRERMAGFKRPRRFVFGEIPKTATGKMQKFLLRQMAAELVEREKHEQP